MGQALLIFVHFSVCDVNSHVNNLKGSTSQTVSGWKFDKVEEGPWTYADVEGRDTQQATTYMGSIFQFLSRMLGNDVTYNSMHLKTHNLTWLTL